MDRAAGLALIRPMLPQNSVYIALTAPCLRAYVLRTLATAGEAQKFPFAASARNS